MLFQSKLPFCREAIDKTMGDCIVADFPERKRKNAVFDLAVFPFKDFRSCLQTETGVPYDLSASDDQFLEFHVWIRWSGMGSRAYDVNWIPIESEHPLLKLHNGSDEPYIRLAHPYLRITSPPAFE